ncbi:Nif11-like leader peptide family natural product precursor [Prochlorococcus sp. MIT 1306]|uniref:Nif11-like leader peptide family natural product precursor n=1 Tax=Prochlorococcus sp. MIT 1306 TaxID=1799667 RepID=UPI001E5AF56C|nr:Nif11-like leader peptide family natural product precursor [Prochlorococcus sp. MIT 1306]
MSKAQVDSSLQDQLKADGVDVVSIAKTAGFLITTEDLNTHRQNLSDEELEGVPEGAPSLSASSCRGSSRDFDP